MLEIYTDPSIWAREKARNSIKGLDALRDKMSKDSLDAFTSRNPEPEDVVEAAQQNLAFIHEQVAPIVGDYFILTRKKLDFKASLFARVSLFGTRHFTFNDPKFPGRMSFVFQDGEKAPSELTPEVLSRNYNANTHSNLVTAFAKLSQEEILARFRQALNSAR